MNYKNNIEKVEYDIRTF